MHQNWGRSGGLHWEIIRRYPGEPRLVYPCQVGHPPLAIHSCGRSLTAAKAPASNHHSTHVHDLSAADRAQQQCRSQLAVSRLQWELAHSSLLSRHITTIPVATPKKLMTLQKNTSSSRTSLVQVQRDRGMHAWCMGRIYTLHVRDVRVLLFPVCIELLTTSSSIRSSHLHAGDEVIVGPDGERRVLKPWPQVSTWHLAVKSQCSDPSTSCQSNVAEALLTACLTLISTGHRLHRFHMMHAAWQPCGCTSSVC
jgi:hypothetical protein